MAKIPLILADSDEFFSNRFSRYILEHNNFFDIISFTEIEYLIEYISKNAVGVVLIEKNFLIPEVVDRLKESLLLVFDEASGEDENYCYVNKYQKTESLVKEITFKYAESIGDKSIVSGGTSSGKIISVYSPVGGSGKTSVALALAGGLVQNGNKTVYLNLEKIDSSGTYMDVIGVEGLSEIFLKLKNNSSNLSFDIMKKLLIDQSGLNYFAPAESAMEFNEMSDDEMITLIQETVNIADLDYVVIDLPSEFNSNIINILKMSNQVVFVSTNDAVGLHKTKMFMKEINIFPDLRIVFEKFIPIINKSDVAGVSQQAQEIFGEKRILASIPVITALKSAQSVMDISRCMDNFLIEVMRLIMGR